MYNVNINLKSDTITGPKEIYIFDIGEDWRPTLQGVLNGFKSTADRFNSQAKRIGRADYYIVNVESSDKKVESEIVSYVKRISTKTKRPNKNWNS